jgi:hypothetical protein
MNEENLSDNIWWVLIVVNQEFFDFLQQAIVKQIIDQSSKKKKKTCLNCHLLSRFHWNWLGNKLGMSSVLDWWRMWLAIVILPLLLDSLLLVRDDLVSTRNFSTSRLREVSGFLSDLFLDSDNIKNVIKVKSQGLYYSRMMVCIFKKNLIHQLGKSC